VLTRDVATYAIYKEVEAGRGSPAGGAYLSFTHVPEAELLKAFGPVIGRLAKNGIDLTRMPVEVAPIAHYHMGGVRVDASMETRVPNLFAAGEAVGGASGANRLSGNAITEAFVFGERAGTSAAARAKARAASGWDANSAATAVELFNYRGNTDAVPNTAALLVELQALMADHVGPFRTEEKLKLALARLEQMQRQLGALPGTGDEHYNMLRLDWFDLRNMLLVAQCVVLAAIERKESRGAHQREDIPGMLPQWDLNQLLSLRDGKLSLRREPAKQSGGIKS
jgi:succinate dehydrogenase/fumarate reductase flavoprotein subunit